MRTVQQIKDDSKSVLGDILSSKKACEDTIDSIDLEISKWNKEREKQITILNELRKLEEKHNG